MTRAVWVDPDADAELSAGAAPGADEVHVWRLHLDLPPDRIDELAALLSRDERARAERLRLPGPRAHFTASRGRLRRVIGRYLSVAPQDITFCYGELGKPALAGPGGRLGLRFNLTHSADLALVAVAAGREVGVDVEHLARPVDADRIARRFFAPDEAARIRRCAPGARQETFYRIWTRKEALAKAVGEGLRLVLRERAGGATPPDGWKIHELDPGPGYVAALAVATSATPCRIRLLQASPWGPRS